MGQRRILERAFYKKELSGEVDIPGQTVEIGDYAYGECRGITGVVIPIGVRRIGRHAFYNCRGLKKVVLPGTGIVLEDGAFKNCHALSFIVLTGCEEETSCLRNILYDVEQAAEVRLEGKEGWEAGLYFPAGQYEYVANEPARIFSEETHGSGCFYRQCAGTPIFDYERYDGLFAAACREETQETAARIALLRLTYPYRLKAAAKERYEEYMRKEALFFVKQAAKEEAGELLDFLLCGGLLLPDYMEAATEILQRAGRTAMVGRLMEYRLKHKRAAWEEWEL